jgi:hypothetical protein
VSLSLPPPFSFGIRKYNRKLRERERKRERERERERLRERERERDGGEGVRGKTR